MLLQREQEWMNVASREVKADTKIAEMIETNVKTDEKKRRVKRILGRSRKLRNKVQQSSSRGGWLM